MIFPYQIKQIAEDYLKLVLAAYPDDLEYLLNPNRFSIWCRLCADRFCQFELAGWIRSRNAFRDGVRKFAAEYARHQIKKRGSQLSKMFEEK